MDSPQDAGFESEALEAAFRAEGDDLAECLMAELGPDYKTHLLNFRTSAAIFFAVS